MSVLIYIFWNVKTEKQQLVTQKIDYQGCKKFKHKPTFRLYFGIPGWQEKTRLRYFSKDVVTRNWQRVSSIAPWILADYTRESLGSG